MASIIICSDFGAQKNSQPLFLHLFCHEVMGPDAMIFVFWMLSFKPTFSLSSFIKRLFSSSWLSAIRVVSPAYLRSFIFLPAIFLMYSFSYLEPVCFSMSSSNCCFLTCIQVSQEAGQVVWYSHLFQNFPQFVVIHTVKGFGIARDL